MSELNIFIFVRLTVRAVIYAGGLSDSHKLPIRQIFSIIFKLRISLILQGTRGKSSIEPSVEYENKCISGFATYEQLLHIILLKVPAKCFLQELDIMHKMCQKPH